LSTARSRASPMTRTGPAIAGPALQTVKTPAWAARSLPLRRVVCLLEFERDE
jgi:hypothetical protein